MIKASEFRLGNLIQSDGEVFTIDSISEDIIHAGALGIYKAGFVEDYGIELTPEWLERFGFKQNYDSENWWNKEEDCSIDVEPTLSDNGVQNLFYYRLSADRRKTLVYVHQLQNLFFALTGREL